MASFRDAGFANVDRSTISDHGRLFINAAPTISCPREKSWRAADGGTGDATPVTGIVATAGDTVATGSMFFSSFFFEPLLNQQPPFLLFLSSSTKEKKKQQSSFVTINNFSFRLRSHRSLRKQKHSTYVHYRTPKKPAISLSLSLIPPRAKKEIDKQSSFCL
jgi:hypothetical protein